MRIRINDDFDMKKIQLSGQCFRVVELENHVFRFITGKHVVYIRKLDEDSDKSISVDKQLKTDDEIATDIFVNEANHVDENAQSLLEVSCTKEEWDEIWTPYFDLDRNYADIANTEYGKHHFADSAIAFGRGLRILKQDKWEMLVTFIISQRKSIPAISSCVEALCRSFGEKIELDSAELSRRFGEKIELDSAELSRSFGEKIELDSAELSRSINENIESDLYTNSEEKATDFDIAEAIKKDIETLYSFPEPDKLCQATAEDFKECGLGYRAPYVRDAAEKVASGELDIEEIASLSDEDLFEKLMTVHGVGKKVANCVLLFGYSRTARVPIDVWIQRAIEEECDGIDPFPLYGENGGIIQQYVFFLQKNAPKRVFPMLCPCCKKGEIDEPHEICPVCGWEDDKLQNIDENLADGANGISMKQYRKKHKI